MERWQQLGNKADADMACLPRFYDVKAGDLERIGAWFQSASG